MVGKFVKWIIDLCLVIDRQVQILMVTGNLLVPM